MGREEEEIDVKADQWYKLPFRSYEFHRVNNLTDIHLVKLKADILDISGILGLNIRFFFSQFRMLLLCVKINPAIWENRQNEIVQGLFVIRILRITTVSRGSEIIHVSDT